MLDFLARCLLSAIIFCLPLLFIIQQSGEPNTALILLVPFIGLIPAFAMALVLFVPLEKLTAWAGMGWLANVLVPLAGMAGTIAALAFLAHYLDAIEAFIRNHEKQPWGTYAWLGVGFVWGMVWRLAGLIDGLIGLGPSARSAR